jgi:hypothetical protein
LKNEILGVIIQNDLKCNSQCIKAVKTANRVLGMVKRTFTVRDNNIILQLYKLIFGIIWMKVLLHVIQLTGLKIESINICMVEGLYKLLIKLPSLRNTILVEHNLLIIDCIVQVFTGK